MAVQVEQLITEHLELWTQAQTAKSTSGRGSNNKIELTGIKKLRELILELAVRGKLVPQDPNDEPASQLLKRIAAEKETLIKAGKLKKQKPLPPITDEEKHFELPAGWVWCRIGLLTDAITSGGTPSKNNPEFWGGNIPWASVKDLNCGKYIASTQDFITPKGLEAGSKLAETGDVLICTRMGLGKITICLTDIAINQDLKAIKLNKNISVDYFFLMYGTLKVIGTGTTVAGIKQDELLNYTFGLPPLNEQLRITSRVDELMALCDQLEQQSYQQLDAHNQLVDALLATLTQSQNADELASNWQRLAEHFDTLFTTEYSIDALKQTILQLAVMGKLVKQDPNDEPASELLKRIAAEKDALVKAGKIKKQKPLPPISDDEKPFELPDGWAREALGHLISISSGDGLTSSQMSPAGTIPVFGGNGINGFHDKGNVNEPTLVIGRVGYYCGSVHITPEMAWITDNAFITSFDTRLFDINYLALLLKGTNLKENENATAQPVISGRKLYPIKVSFPPLDEQIRILRKYNELTSLCDFLKVKTYEANKTKTVLSEALVEQVIA